MKRKKLISGIMALALVSAIVPYSPIVANADTTYIINQVDHKCGDNATWSFDETTGTLTISGTGDTYDYTMDTAPFGYSNCPIDRETHIKKIVVEEGITSLGDYILFTNSEPLNYVESISLPESLVRIGNSSICGFTCNLKEVNIPNNLKSIGDNAFLKWEDDYSANPIKSMTIPKSVESIGKYAIGYIEGDVPKAAKRKDKRVFWVE